MADFIRVAPFPPELREPLRAALRGQPATWPNTLGTHEIDALEEHGALPLVYSFSHIPALRERAIRAATTEAIRHEELRRVLGALGVFVLVVKGSALAHQVYPSPELRPRSDTDLLIDAADLDAARAGLRALGYYEATTSGDELALAQRTFTRLDDFGCAHVLDVHWEIANTPLFAGALRFAELKPRAVAINALGPHAHGLSRVDALLLACIHRVAHHHDSDRLIWLYDIHLLRERMSAEEHRRFWELAAEGEMIEICERGIALAGEWFGAEPHDRAADHLGAERLARAEAASLYLDPGLRRGGMLAANLVALPTWRARVQRLRQLAFPPRRYMEEQFGTSSAVVLPWLYAWRGVRGVARLFRRIA